MSDDPELEKLLKIMSKENASDLFITVGAPPTFKIDGKMMPLNAPKLMPDQVQGMVFALMKDSEKNEFSVMHECNFSISRPFGRFRVSAFMQRNQPGMVLRQIQMTVPSLDELGLPQIIKRLSLVKRGLVLFVGGTGTGKSTSLAAMVDYRNKQSPGHIITIEDPIEFLHRHQHSIVTQREVGVDTESYEIALKNTLRQAPDVIMIGEIRTQDTMGYAIAFAETGHLCLATLHANNANQALDRIIHFFPAERYAQIWLDLSLNLRAIIAQRLVPTSDGKSRRAVVEILINTPAVSDAIRKGDVSSLKSLMSRSTEQGMQTFDQALFNLFEEGVIDYDVALSYADSLNNLRLMIKLQSKRTVEAGLTEEEEAAEKLKLEKLDLE